MEPGNPEDFTKAAKFSCISGLSASSVFHFNKLEILDLKKELKENNVEIVEWKLLFLIWVLTILKV